MTKPAKSSVEEIKHRFDNDVERFSQLEIGNTAQIDSAMSLDLIARVAARTNPNAKRLLDIGCGAGNYSLKMLERIPDMEVTLVDLSQPMLDRAAERIAAVTRRAVVTIQGDIRQVDLDDEEFDIAVGGAVFHHLREDAEWHATFRRIHQSLRSGGTFWVYDLLDHEMEGAEQEMQSLYAQYLVDLKGPEYRDLVFGWIEKEDTPRPLTFQLDVMRQAGFDKVDVLHKNISFAVYGGMKA
ncbi:class I SAM-dependent methyltransferase [bacterium]|nr:class I SAM-dependent methyltransferase [bacterium]